MKAASQIAFGVLLVQELVSPGDCSEILSSAIKNNRWRPARVGEYSDGRLLRAIEDSSASTAEVTQTFDRDLEIFNRLRLDVSRLLAKNFGLSVRKFSNLSISRYPPGSFVGRHRDTTTFSTPRMVTVILYLNDEYEGGKLIFPDIGVTYQPAKGDVVLFLSEYFHAVSTVTSGHRYCVIFFAEN
jgi:predicted 2-oxoglutarate/Fe(II)-dependent dioxygenase YbiX